MNKKKVLDSLNKILEHELAGVVKYTHYAFMVQGPYRLSVVEWLRQQAQESLAHAEAVGEHVTSLENIRHSRLVIFLKHTNIRLRIF